jgi:hypothetical protein
MPELPTLVMVLVDALSAEYVRPDWMPFLSRLAKEGKAVGIKPEPFFPGADPILYGCSGRELGRLTGYCFDPDRAPYSRIPPHKIYSLDYFPKNRGGKLFRTMQARRLLNQAGAEWLPPQLFPVELLVKLAPPPFREPPKGHFVEKAEKAGFRARWYTRDFPHEGQKWLGSQFFDLRYRKVFEEWILAEEPEKGPPGLILFELSVLLDRYGHRHGPEHERSMKEAAKIVDGRLEGIWERMQKWKNLHWLVIGDHGMSQVKQHWDLAGALQKAGLWGKLESQVIINSTLAQFCIQDDSLRQATAGILDRDAPGQVVFPDRFKAFGIPDDTRWGDLVLLVEEGVLLLPNHFQGSRAARGMHGYGQSRTAVSHPAAVFWGPEWNFEQVHEAMPMADLCPVLCRLIRIDNEY